MLKLKYKVTEKHLKNNPNHIFVFGDNLLREGYGGAAKLRNCVNTFGFVTKKAPNNNKASFYTPKTYFPIFEKELRQLIKFINVNPKKFILISPVGSGLANRFGIWEEVIKPNFERLLAKFDNVLFLWED